MNPIRRLVPNRWVRLLLAGALLTVAAVVLGRQAWAYSEFRAAQREAARYKLDAAQAHLTECLKIWGAQSSVWALAGQIARRREAYDEAERYLVEAQKRSGGVAGEDVLLERVLLQAQLDPDAKLEYLRSLVLADHPQSALIMEAMTRGFLRKNRYSDAGFVLEKWLERTPDDVFALFCRGWVRDQLGPRVQAIDDYQRVLELDPDHDEARLRLARLLIEMARPSDALATARPLAAKHGGEPKILVLLAECEAAVGNRAAAEAAARAALAIDPAFDDALAVLGATLFDAEQFAEAERALREAVRIRPSHYQAHLTLHRLLVATGRTGEAAKVKVTLDQMARDITRMRDIFALEFAKTPKNAALYREVGAIFLRAGEVAKGLQWLTDAEKLDPDSPDVHRDLAAAYARLGNRERAEYHKRKGGATPPAP